MRVRMYTQQVLPGGCRAKRSTDKSWRKLHVDLRRSLAYTGGPRLSLLDLEIKEFISISCRLKWQKRKPWNLTPSMIVGLKIGHTAANGTNGSICESSMSTPSASSSHFTSVDSALHPFASPWNSQRPSALGESIWAYVDDYMPEYG